MVQPGDRVASGYFSWTKARNLQRIRDTSFQSLAGPVLTSWVPIAVLERGRAC